jgi:hypothetical protein
MTERALSSMAAAATRSRSGGTGTAGQRLLVAALYNDKHFFPSERAEPLFARHQEQNLKRNADSLLTLYAGAKSPGADKEWNWLPAPNRPFSLYIRGYWGKDGILGGSWQPPPVAKKLRRWG